MIETKETYHEVCQQIADWIYEGTKDRNPIKMSAKDVLTLHDDGKFIVHIHEFKNYMDKGYDPINVLISVEHLAKLVMTWVDKQKKADI